MNNPMRDVIEQMKSTARCEGKQQTSPQVIVAMEKRHLREKLDMARNASITLAQSLLDADLWAENPMADRVIALYGKAQDMQSEIEALLKETGGRIL